MQREVLTQVGKECCLYLCQEQPRDFCLCGFLQQLLFSSLKGGFFGIATHVFRETMDHVIALEWEVLP